MSTQHTCSNLTSTALDIAHAIVDLFDETDPTEQFVPYGKYMLRFAGGKYPDHFDVNVYSAVTDRSFDIENWYIPDSDGCNLIDFVEDLGYIVAMLVEAEK